MRYVTSVETAVRRADWLRLDLSVRRPRSFARFSNPASKRRSRALCFAETRTSTSVQVQDASIRSGIRTSTARRYKRRSSRSWGISAHCPGIQAATTASLPSRSAAKNSFTKRSCQTGLLITGGNRTDLTTTSLTLSRRTSPRTRQWDFRLVFLDRTRRRDTRWCFPKSPESGLFENAVIRQRGLS